jgi:hypothetical protein
MKPETVGQLQQRFQEYLLGPREEDVQSSIAAAIAADTGLPAKVRLKIYFDAYRSRLRDALSEMFGKTALYVGDGLFASLCDRYIQQQPSTTRNLRWYGHRFSNFLTQEVGEHPAVAELAAFEWSLGMAFDAEDAQVLCADDVRHLTAEQWGRIGFALHPSVQILDLRSNAPSIWSALERKRDPPAAVHSIDTEAWLIWRQRFEPHFRSMDRLETAALRGLQHGHSFAMVCDDAIEGGSAHEVVLPMARWLQTWLNEAVLTAYTP